MDQEEDDYDEDADAAYPLAAKVAMERNVRCSLAYMSTRLDRLHRVAWESGKQLPPHIAANLTTGEIRYFETYCAQLDAYTNEYANYSNLDLTVDLTPPKDLFIEVRIKKDLGEMVLPESGQVLMQKDTTHLLRRSEADPLIK